MNPKHFLIIPGLAALAFPLSAQAPSPSELAKRGANAYIKEGPDAGISLWLKGSVHEANPQSLTAIRTIKGTEENHYGKATGFDVISERVISPKVRIVYFVMYFQKAPIFLRLDAFEATPGNWLTSYIQYAQEPEQVFPKSTFESLAPAPEPATPSPRK